jgi:hypothetical protein
MSVDMFDLYMHKNTVVKLKSKQTKKNLMKILKESTKEEEINQVFNKGEHYKITSATNNFDFLPHFNFTFTNVPISGMFLQMFRNLNAQLQFTMTKKVEFTYHIYM